MVYSNNLVVVVKYNGEILRERDGVISLPFGSEYTILLKNLESRRANVNISIDGKDVLDGSSLIVSPNSETELKGFLKGSTVRNSFKFIQKTKEIVDHRGDFIDDGIIRIEFAFEKKVINQEINTTWHYWHDDCWPWYHPYPYRPWYIHPCDVSDNINWTYKVDDSNSIYCNCSNSNSKPDITFTSNFVADNSWPEPDEGITVKGKEIRQDFFPTTVGDLEPSSVIILKLRGAKSNGSVVEKPITTVTKLECSTCGKKWKSSVKYCPNCGTCLI